MMKNRYIINPSYLIVDNSYDEIYISERLYKLKCLIIDNQINDAVFLPSEIIELISGNLFSTFTEVRKNTSDIYKTLLFFLDRINPRYCISSSLKEISINPSIFEDYVNNQVAARFLNCAYDSRASIFLSDNYFINSNRYESFAITHYDYSSSIDIYQVQNEKKHFPFFEPSDKHSYLKIHVSKSGRSYLSKSDEEACYKIIKKAIDADGESKAMFGYIMESDTYIRFHYTGGESLRFHAHPVIPYKDHQLNDVMLKRLHEVFPKKK